MEHELRPAPALVSLNEGNQGLPFWSDQIDKNERSLELSHSRRLARKIHNPSINFKAIFSSSHMVQPLMIRMLFLRDSHKRFVPVLVIDHSNLPSKAQSSRQSP